MKSKARRFASAFVSDMLSVFLSTKISAVIFDEFFNAARSKSRTITHNKTSLSFATPNRLNRYRVETFDSKEPETLEWIDGFSEGSVLWDIGANVGLYSCYAAKARRCRVIAFEPSVFNLELISRNIFINNLTAQVTIIPLPLSDSLGVSTLNMTNTEWGGALSTFGQEYGWDGLRIDKEFEFSTLGVRADDVTALFKLPPPDYIKIDVDGIEHLILNGAQETLKKVRGVLVEINDGFHVQAKQSEAFLVNAGLVLKEKKHSEMFDGVDSFGHGKIWNQIWVRS